MKAIFISFVIFVTYTILQNVAEDASIYGMQGLKLICDDASKLEFVSKYQYLPGYDFFFLTRNVSVPVEVLVDSNVLDSFKQNLTANGIQYEVVIKDMSVIIKQMEMGRTKRDTNDNFFYRYPRHDEIKSFLKKLESNNKKIVTYFELGTSYEGREIMGVKISLSDTKNRRAIVIDAGIHAREWIAPTTALYIINEIVEKPSNHYLLNMNDFYIIPLLNPDGYEYTHNSSETRLWRKTRSTRPDTKCIGVDANRNFDIAWTTTGPMADPCSAIYPGLHPFSEPETKALKNFLLSLKSIKAYITFHSFGNLILYPWSYTNHKHQNDALLKCMAKEAARAVRKVYGTRYTIGTAAKLLYVTTGSSHDWAMASAKVDLAYAIELPGKMSEFELPNTQIIPIGEETFEAIKVFSEFSPYELTICPISL